MAPGSALERWRQARAEQGGTPRRRLLLAQRQCDLDARCERISRMWNDLQVDEAELHDIYTSCDAKTLAPAPCPPAVQPRTRSELSNAPSEPQEVVTEPSRAKAKVEPAPAEAPRRETEPARAAAAVPWRPLVRHLHTLRQHVELMTAQVDGMDADMAAGAPVWPLLLVDEATDDAVADSADPTAAVVEAVAALARQIGSLHASHSEQRRHLHTGHQETTAQLRLEGEAAREAAQRALDAERGKYDALHREFESAVARRCAAAEEAVARLETRNESLGAELRRAAEDGERDRVEAFDTEARADERVEAARDEERAAAAGELAAARAEVVAAFGERDAARRQRDEESAARRDAAARYADDLGALAADRETEAAALRAEVAGLRAELSAVVVASEREGAAASEQEAAREMAAAAAAARREAALEESVAALRSSSHARETAIALLMRAEIRACEDEGDALRAAIARRQLLLERSEAEAKAACAQLEAAAARSAQRAEHCARLEACVAEVTAERDGVAARHAAEAETAARERSAMEEVASSARRVAQHRVDELHRTVAAQQHKIEALKLQLRGGRSNGAGKAAPAARRESFSPGDLVVAAHVARAPLTPVFTPRNAPRAPSPAPPSTVRAATSHRSISASATPRSSGSRPGTPRGFAPRKETAAAIDAEAKARCYSELLDRYIVRSPRKPKEETGIAPAAAPPDTPRAAEHGAGGKPAPRRLHLMQLPMD